MSKSSVYPGAQFVPLPEAATQARITPRLVIVHTNGGPTTSTPGQLWTYLSRLDVGVESHFDVALDGTVLQLMPAHVRADANYRANAFQVPGDPTMYGALSIETQDHGYKNVPTDADPWSTAQVESIAQILAWANQELGIPLQRPQAWNGTGVDIHRSFPEWSAASHSCPGAARAAQWPGIVQRAQEIVRPPVHVLVTDSEEEMIRFVRKAGTGDVWEVVHDNGYTWAFHIGGPDDPGAHNEVLDGLFYDPAKLGELSAAVLDGLPHSPR